MRRTGQLLAASLAMLSVSVAGAEVLRGIVRGPEGLPLPGVAILLVQVSEVGAGDPEVQLLDETDLAGGFEADVKAPLGLPGVWLVFDKAPYAISHHPWSYEWPLAADLGSGRNIEVKLVAGSDFKGVLTAADGTPITGATVTPLFPIALPGYEDLGTLFPPLDARFGVSTDEAGAFSLNRMPPGVDFGLRIYAPGRGWNLAGVTLSTFGDRLNFSSESDVRQLTFSSRAEVNGVVVSRDTGKPCAGVSVIARSSQASFTGAFLPELEVKTDSAGRYRFEGLPSAHYALQAVAPDQRSAPIMVEAIQPSIFSAPEIRLGAVIRYHGRIADAETGATFVGGDVKFRMIREGASDAEPPPVVRADGTFEGYTAAGWVTLSAFSERMDVLPEDREKRLILSQGHAHDLAIRVRRYATVDVQVLMPDGTPAGDAIVTDPVSRTASWTCDGEGWLRIPFASFRFEDTGARLALEAHAKGDTSLRGCVSIPLVAGAQPNNTITLQPAATLSGVVIDRQGVPQPGKTVYLVRTVPDSGADVRDSVVAGANGEFSLSNIVPGADYWYHAGGTVTKHVFAPGESLEARIVSTNPSVEILQSMSPEVLNQLPREIREQIGITGENAP
jgi:hypothetical protein